MSAKLVNLPVSPHQHHQGKLSSTAPVSSLTAAGSKEWGQYSCSHVLGPAHSHSYHQGQFYCFAQARYPVRPVLLPAAAGKDRGHASFPHPCHHMADEGGRVSTPALMLLLPPPHPAHCAPTNRVSSIVLPG